MELQIQDLVSSIRKDGIEAANAEALRQNGFAGMNLEGHLHRLHWGDSGKLL